MVCIPLPDSVLRAIEKLNDAGCEAYIVGGCVRDALMGKVPSDWDITTSATPEQILDVFSEMRTIETGREHGTVTVLIDSMPLEITTFRVDGEYSDGRHPDAVIFTTLLADDLCRRDFTINAMAYHPKSGLIDLFGGRADIKERCMRCVGDPYQRFSEDALRILRGLRFAATLGFDIDSDTAQALIQLAPSLSKVSVERIATEFKKLLCGVGAENILRAYRTIVAEFIPEIAPCTDFDLLSAVRPAVGARMASLLYAADLSPVEAEVVLRRLRFDNKTIRDVVLLLTPINQEVYTEEAYLLHLLRLVGPELIFDYLAIRECALSTFERAQQLIAEGRCYCLSMLAVNGHDLITSGIAAGATVGELLDELLNAVIHEICANNKAELLQYAKTIKQPAP